MFKTVLFSLDASPEARHAAGTAASVVKYHHSRLVLLSVVEAVGGRPEQTSPATVAQLLDQAKAVFHDQGIEAETIEREGNPAFVICDVADEVSADLIVIGCSSVGLTEDQAESVSHRVINLAPCPVLVVP